MIKIISVIVAVLVSLLVHVGGHADITRHDDLRFIDDQVKESSTLLSFIRHRTHIQSIIHSS